MRSIVAFIVWDPSKTAFTLPFIEHPVAWYGILFVIGFALGYLVEQFILARTLSVSPFSDTTISLADRLLWSVIFGTIVGARLGHVLFYDINYYISHPIEIFMTWRGGLASHGGAIGIVIALFLFRLSVKRQYPTLTFLKILDIVTIPTALGCVFIRLGNFINQEIIGTPSSTPWAVLFVHPAEGGPITPRHPVQLYEALAYLAIFVILYVLWKKNPNWADGKIAGLFFILAFSARFFLEFFKSWQDSPLTAFSLQAGQLLSLPFILLGFYLYKRKAIGMNPCI